MAGIVIRMRLFAVRVVSALVLLGAPPLPAQAPQSTAVTVVVRDTTRRIVVGAEVTVVRGLHDVIGSASTDARGTAMLSVTHAAEDLQLVVRRIGFEPTNRFVRLDSASATFDVVLRRSPQALAPVTINAERDLKRESYHIDADQIAASDRTLLDATDILAKLRPDMICGRECFKLGGTIASLLPTTIRCPGLVMAGIPASCPADDTPPSLKTNVWVNGIHITMIAPDPMAVARQTGPLGALSPGAMTVLSEIKPEHIAEITYLDSNEKEVVRAGARDAIFIVLKPGVVYRPGADSYVADVAPSGTASNTGRTSLAYRTRLLGLYDGATGDPIAGATVLDVDTGDRAQTAADGSVNLVFLPEGLSHLRISKSEFADLELTVQIAPTQTSPLTLIMSRR